MSRDLNGKQSDSRENQTLTNFQAETRTAFDKFLAAIKAKTPHGEKSTVGPADKDMLQISDSTRIIEAFTDNVAPRTLCLESFFPRKRGLFRRMP
jgi:hypothetical protein